MKVPRIYVDTSVIGGCHDPEFAPWSRQLIRDFEEAIIQLVISDLTIAEIERAPLPVRMTYNRLMEFEPEIIKASVEARNLAGVYLQRKILFERSRADAVHIALATISQVDLLVSWNFRDIVHFDKISRFNSVNLELGYKPILIYSPQEVASYE